MRRRLLEIILAQAPQLSGEVTGEIALEDDPGLGIGFEIPPQRCHVPAQRTHRLHCHRVHFGRGAAQHECGADDIPGPQLTQDPSVLRHTHVAADNECDRPGRRAVLDQTLAGSRCGPGPEADKLQNLARRQLRERKPANLLLVGRQLTGRRSR